LPHSGKVCTKNSVVRLWFTFNSKNMQGDYKGIMVVVTPCRSDRSTLGLLPYSHLNDGRLHLVLIRTCSVLQYLRFLASIPQTGHPSSLLPPAPLPPHSTGALLYCRAYAPAPYCKNPLLSCAKTPKKSLLFFFSPLPRLHRRPSLNNSSAS